MTEGHGSPLQTPNPWVQALCARIDNPMVFFLAVLVIVLNLADAVFTDFILAHGGWEVNPIARGAIAAFGDHFWVWKYCLVSFSVILLSGYVHMRMARVCLAVAAVLYSAVTVWHLILIDTLSPMF